MFLLKSEFRCRAFSRNGNFHRFHFAFASMRYFASRRSSSISLIFSDSVSTWLNWPWSIANATWFVYHWSSACSSGSCSRISSRSAFSSSVSLSSE